MRARGKGADYGAVLSSMRRRDQIDSNREISPLRVAEDAFVLDTDGVDIEDVLARAVRLVEDRGRETGSQG